jgi:hypothetical protein
MNKPHCLASQSLYKRWHASTPLDEKSHHISVRKCTNISAKVYLTTEQCQVLKFFIALPKRIFSTQFELKHSNQYEPIGSYQNPMVITTSCASQNFFRLRQSLNTQVKSIWRYKHNDRFKNTIHSWNRTKETNCVTSAQLKILGDHGNSNANFTHA